MGVIIVLLILVALIVAVQNKKSGGTSDGRAAGKTKRCPNCGAEIPADARECGWCGDFW